jgi:hypothetical protein
VPSTYLRRYLTVGRRLTSQISGLTADAGACRASAPGVGILACIAYLDNGECLPRNMQNNAYAWWSLLAALGCSSAAPPSGRAQSLGSVDCPSTKHPWNLLWAHTCLTAASCTSAAAGQRQLQPAGRPPLMVTNALNSAGPVHNSLTQIDLSLHPTKLCLSYHTSAGVSFTTCLQGAPGAHTP